MSKVEKLLMDILKDQNALVDKYQDKLEDAINKMLLYVYKMSDRSDKISIEKVDIDGTELMMTINLGVFFRIDGDEGETTIEKIEVVLDNINGEVSVGEVYFYDETDHQIIFQISEFENNIKVARFINNFLITPLSKKYKTDMTKKVNESIKKFKDFDVK